MTFREMEMEWHEIATKWHEVTTEWNEATERMKTTSAKFFAKLRNVKAEAGAAKVAPGPAGLAVHAEPAAGSTWSK